MIVYGERLTHGARGEHAARALLNVAGRVVSAGHEGSGLLELPAGTNGRGLREAGVLPNAGPGPRARSAPPASTPRRSAPRPPRARSRALYLLHVDPLRDLPSRRIWRAALRAGRQRHRARRASVARACGSTPTIVFPAESYAEKEGTVTHPDGRVQRLRPAIARPDAVRAEWNVLADLSRRLGHDPEVLSGPMASARLFEAVPFYAGLTLDELGGRGVRWPARPAAAAWPAADTGPFGLEAPPHAPTPNGALRLGTFRSIWAAPEVELSPALKFLRQHQRAELSPADAERLGIAHGDRVDRRLQRHARQRDGRCCARPSPRARSSSRRASPRTRPASSTSGLVEVVAAVSGSVIAAVGYAEEWYIQIIKSIVLFALAVQIVPVVLLAERKLLGRFQHRYGPNRVGPFGMAQPLADIIKLATKEPFQPSTAVGFLYALAPVISLLTALAAFAILPFGDVATIFGTEVGLYGLDVGIGVLYVFAFGAIAFYGLMLGGWASGSKYSFLGAMRAAAQLISYEVAMGLSLVGVLMMAGTLSLTGDRRGAVEHVVHRPAVRRLPDLPDGRLRGDQPRAVRPARGRRRARRRLQHRVRRLEVRGVLLRRVREHPRRLGHRGDDVPRRLAAAVHRPARLRRPVRRARQDLRLRVPVRLDPRDAAAAALRPAHELRLEGAAAAGDG